MGLRTELGVVTNLHRMDSDSEDGLLGAAKRAVREDADDREDEVLGYADTAVDGARLNRLSRLKRKAAEGPGGLKTARLVHSSPGEARPVCY